MTSIVKCCFLFLFFFYTHVGFGQIEDCVGAYPVCGNGSINFSPTGPGRDDFALPGNFSPTCGFSENESIWIKIRIKSAGSLGFDLIPFDNQGAGRDDYDFALYGPTEDCANLGHSIRCSSTNPQQANVGANTGMNQSSTEFNEGPGQNGDGYIHWLDNVLPNQTYYLMIDNFDEDKGFKLNWTGTALLEDNITKEQGGVDLGPDVDLCDNQSLTLDAFMNGATSYQWNTGESTRQITVTKGGQYFVTAYTESGCLSRDTIAVTIIPSPIIDRIEAIPNNRCEPIATVDLRVEGSVGTYQWFDPQMKVIGNSKNIQLTNVAANQSGQYTFRITAANGCQSEQKIDVDIYPLPQLDIQGLQPYCEKNRLEWTASGAQSYKWFSPSQQLISTTDQLIIPSLQISDSGTYTLEGISAQGCENTRTIDIQVFPEFSIDIPVDSINACEGDEFLAIAGTANQSNVQFEWISPTGQSVSQSASLELRNLRTEQSGSYRLLAKNAGGCMAQDEVYIDIGPTYYFPNLIEQCPGTTFQVPQTGELVTKTDTVMVNLKTQIGCDSIYFYDVQFLSCSNSSCIGIPNAFAPNGNSLNEAFELIFSQTCIPDKFELVIFNRWGNEVYRTTDFDDGWQGRYEGELAQPGLYLWKVKYQFDDDENEIHSAGNFTLVR